MNDEKKIRKTFLFSPSLVEVVKKLKDDMNQNSETAVVIEAINALNRKINPGYISQRVMSASKTPEDKAETQIRIQEIKKQKEEEALLVFATALEARITLSDSGSKMVEFYNYDKGNRYFQKLPLRMMNQQLVDDQYYPSREEIKKRQAEGKVNYDPKSWEY